MSIGVEGQLVAVDLHQQERPRRLPNAVSGEPLRRCRRAAACPPIRRRSDDAVLRLDPLVEVIVAGEHDADTVLDEQRLEHRPQLRSREPCRAPTSRAGGGSRGSSISRDFFSSRSIQPICWVQVGDLEREEADVLLRRLERVIELAVHVEQRRRCCSRVVVVAERGVELDAVIEQRLVGDLELRA